MLRNGNNGLIRTAALVYLNMKLVGKEHYLTNLVVIGKAHTHEVFCPLFCRFHSQSYTAQD